MDYKNIISAVPEGEHFDATAINEGVWMSQAHLNSIETAMAGYATDLQGAINNTATSIQINEEVGVLLIAANATIAERDATIEALNGQIATLKAAPAAPITQTAKDIDEQGNTVVFESETTKQARQLRELRDGKKK